MIQHLSFSRTLIGHRGASALAPENTLAAMRAARMHGMNWVEFDVHLTQDQVPVIIHDNDLSITTDGRGQVCDMRVDAIMGLDAGSWFSSAFLGEPVPTLKDMITCLTHCALCANIELKPVRYNDERLAQAVLASVDSVWPCDKPAPLFSSFSIDALRALRKFSKKVFLGLLIDAWDKDWPLIVEELGCVSVHAAHHLLTASRVQAIKASGQQVLAYTLDDKQRINLLFDRGVNAIFTNHPYVLST